MTSDQAARRPDDGAGEHMDWTAPHSAHPDLAIAIIGIAVRLPDADTLGELDRNLADGLDSVRPLPAERLEVGGADPADRYPDMAQIGGVEEFDFRFFGLAPAEAEAMDPQHRITLQLACGAVENAGYRLSAVRDRPTGVFLNTPRQDYADLVGTHDLLHMLGTAAPAM